MLRFAYFSRVVPPDNLQAKAMAHLVKRKTRFDSLQKTYLSKIAKLGWNYVHAIVDTGSYGERGMDRQTSSFTTNFLVLTAFEQLPLS